MLDVDYRMIFAVATLDSVIVYDTEKLDPVGFISSIHYAVLTDLSWY
ncbi:hypothetical protein MXB_4611 [Myxobolus squamalis]|nr:hypothetical protein MXB_4611 [Myxobolus squamalis]